MLVLSRRLNEKIVFPGMKASIRVISVKPGQVRLGIEAPREVTVVRGEIEDHSAREAAPEAGDPQRRLQELACERLKQACISLGLARLQLRAGQTRDAQAILDGIHGEIQMLRQEMEGPRCKRTSRLVRRSAVEVETAENDAECELLAGCPG